MKSPLFPILIIAGSFLFWSCPTPLPSNPTPPVEKPTPPTVQIIADHSIVNDYSKIPAQYLSLVKKMWINIPGESHSLAYRVGLKHLGDLESQYAMVEKASGQPEGLGDTHLRVSKGLWTGAAWDYWVGEDLWFTNPAGRQTIKDHFKKSAELNLGLSAIGFGWCYDMIEGNGYSAEYDPVYDVRWRGRTEGGPEGSKVWGLDSGDFDITGNSVCMQTYLDATEEYRLFCQANYPETKVLFTTGPVDLYAGEAGYQRELKHQFIRDFVKENPQRILFDYADIISWDDAGEQAAATWTRNGIAHTFPIVHPDNQKTLDGTADDTSSAGHVGAKAALRLGKAQWWLLARLAGWDGK